MRPCVHALLEMVRRSDAKTLGRYERGLYNARRKCSWITYHVVVVAWVKRLRNGERNGPARFRRARDRSPEPHRKGTFFYKTGMHIINNRTQWLHYDPKIIFIYTMRVAKRS